MKVGTAHSGFGKMRVNSIDELEDFRSVTALQARYVTSEPFIKVRYDDCCCDAVLWRVLAV